MRKVFFPGDSIGLPEVSCCFRKDVNESLSNLYDEERIRIDSKSDKTLNSFSAAEILTICPISKKFFI